ncbi:hypothetical protein [Erwinia sp. 198]|uniref:hypothetical protein n=1 Tax=Erwinia sp. 198 TaxID=2022746 RepID=UPI000F661AA8|nr:hypothetical protein [Erwinia sp. 198]RRZ95518.1 hypothetical protein EGK14_02810 [Erwinia sp. 198]
MGRQAAGRAVFQQYWENGDARVTTPRQFAPFLSNRRDGPMAIVSDYPAICDAPNTETDCQPDLYRNRKQR